jgi:hypothetical protein
MMIITANTSSRYSIGPKEKATKPINHRITSTAATTKRRSNKPIQKPQKNLGHLFIYSCVVANQQSPALFCAELFCVTDGLLPKMFSLPLKRQFIY